MLLCSALPLTFSPHCLFIQVSGLYVMLCIAMGVGAGLVAWHWIYKLHVGPWAHNNPTMQRWFPCYNPRSDFLTRVSGRKFLQSRLGAAAWERRSARPQPTSSPPQGVAALMHVRAARAQPSACCALVGSLILCPSAPKARSERELWAAAPSAARALRAGVHFP